MALRPESGRTLFEPRRIPTASPSLSTPPADGLLALPSAPHEMSARHSASSGTRSRVIVGNDVLDLRHPRCRLRSEEDPLPLRILTDAERAWWRSADEGSRRLRRLWALWAAKETTFKAVSKVEGDPPVFRHRDFHASLREVPGEEVIHLEGTVAWRHHRCQVQGIATDRFLHMIGWISGETGGDNTSAADSQTPPLLEVGIEGCGDEVKGGDGSGAGAALSRRVRKLAAQRLASYLERTMVSGAASGPGRPRIRIGRSLQDGVRRPPTVWVNDQPCREVDLSISHHGRYVAWVLRLPDFPRNPPTPTGARDGGSSPT